MGSVANPEEQIVFYADTFYNADVCTPGSSLGVHTYMWYQQVEHYARHTYYFQKLPGRLYSATLAAEEG